MNHYEELGLTPSASPDEIRQAYKNLARVLHPDQQADGPWRRLAELQMKRLNGIYALLGDPVRRRAYDLTLAGGADAALLPEQPPGPLVSRCRRLVRRTPGDVRVAVGLAGATLVAGAVYWIFTADSKPKSATASGTWAPPAQAADPSPTPAHVLTRELDHLRRRVQTLEAERDAARSQLAELSARTYPAPSPGGGAAPTLPEPPAVSGGRPLVEAVPAVRLPAPGAPPSAEAPRPPSGGARLAGNWFYAPTRTAPAAKALYPPEYIETTIREEGGMLRGRYYGRYRVTDRAISPEVRFYFEGRPQPDHAVCEWQGGGGARGEVRLRLLGENSLEVNWSATELGSTPGLAAGTAVLVRRIE